MFDRINLYFFPFLDLDISGNVRQVIRDQITEDKIGDYQDVICAMCTLACDYENKLAKL